MKFKLLRKIAAVTSFVLFSVVLTGTIVATENSSQINGVLGIQPYEIIQDETQTKDWKELEYYKSEYTKVGDLVAAGRAKAVEEVEEGAVLLKNDKNALPLAKGTKVTLFGSAAADPVYGGTGSGGISTADAGNFKDAMEHGGLVVNETMFNYMTETEGRNLKYWNNYKRGSSGRYGTTTLTINDAPWNVYEEALGDTLSTYKTAVVVIGRRGGEGYDLIRKATAGDAIDNNDGLGPDYLGLNEKELKILENLKAKKDAGIVDKTIVLINYSSMMEGDFIFDAKYGVDAAMWIGAPGLGLKAVGSLLSGDVNPSGRLSDTMWMDNAKNPVNANFKPVIYENAKDLGVSTEVGTGSYPEATMASYSVYQEGMYLGYRYTETRYEDVVLGTAKVGDYNYSDVVAYPFGYGLSYSTFKTDGISVTKTGDREYTVSVTVTNTSNVAGKYSVPVWVSKPYGDYAKKNNVQVPSVELLDFAKTKKLNPGASETLTIKFDEKFFASYDAYNEKGYVLMDGNYYVAVGGDAHEAINNVLMAKKADGVSITESKMVGAGDASKVAKFNYRFNRNKYRYADQASSNDGVVREVTNLFDFSDINRYSGKGNNHVDYYNRDNWAGTVSLDMTNGYAKVTMTEQMAYELYEQTPELTGTYGGVFTGPIDKYKQPLQPDNVALPTMGKDAGLTLMAMKYDSEGKPIEFSDPMWDVFMDQLTYADLVALIDNGYHLTAALPKIVKPQTKDENGPNGFSQTYRNNKTGLYWRSEVAAGHVGEDGKLTSEADPDGSKKTTGFPANGMLAASFNKELARDVGKIIGEDGLWSGCSGLYGLGNNIHRSPYLGRTCEYYSECGTLTGIIAAVESKAIEEKGTHVYNKHCALNDMEATRHGVSCWLPEQALREIYLRAFELPITDGGAFNTMASFARFGTYSGAACGALAQSFLRDECGMKGIIVTDYYGDMDGSANMDAYFEMVYGVYSGGSDVPDGRQPNQKAHFAKFDPATGNNYGKMVNMMRLSAKRVCYQTLWSHAMNGYDSNTRLVPITPWWQTLLITLDVVFGVILLGALVWTGIAIFFEEKERRSKA